MVSSLASQLAQGASLNSALLVDRILLVSSKEAAHHDLEAIYALGLNGFLQLKALKPSLRAYERTLFSDAAKPMTGRCTPRKSMRNWTMTLVLEWLVRRFRINEFNVQDILRVFFPYHESPHFTKMVSLLHITDDSSFRFLIPYKTRAKSLPRAALVTEMLKNADLARFVSDLLPAALKEGGAGSHRTLVAFHTGTLLDFIARQQSLDEGTAAYVLPAAMDPLSINPDADPQFKSANVQEYLLGSFLLLAALAQKCSLSAKALKGIASAVSSCADRVSPKQCVRVLLAILAPQNELEKLPRGVVDSLLGIPNLDKELTDTLRIVGAEKLISPLVARLFTRLADDHAVNLLNSILTCPTVTPPVIRRATAGLLRRLIENDGETDGDDSLANVRMLLVQLQQRHPEITQQVLQEALENDQERDVVERVVVSLASTGRAVQERKPTVRAIATRDLESVKSAIRARATTPTPPSSSALRNPDAVAPVFLEDPSGFVSPPSKSIVRTHLTFAAEHFYRAVSKQEDAVLAARIVDEIFMPFLLFSKPREKTATLVWEIIEATAQDGTDSTALSNHELLGGCVEAVRWEQARQQQQQPEEGEGGYRNVELLAKINLAVSAKIAGENVLASQRYPHHLEILLAKLHDASPYSRAMAYLTTRALLSRLSGEIQLDAAYRVLQAMKFENLDGMGDFMDNVDNVQAFLHDLSLGTVVVLKPNSQQTKHRLQVSILTMIPTIPRPSGRVLDWLAIAPGSDGRDIRYVQLMRAVYSFSNSSSSLPLLSTHLLRLLFVKLGDDALAFLAGIWLNTLVDGTDAVKDSHICYAALRHAAAFLEAHATTEHWVDFQTVLPAILVSLQSPTRRVREAAAECLALIAKISQAKDASAVYAYDTIYGADSASLQYADWTDFRKYMEALADVTTHLIHDGGYLQVLHQEHLAESKTDTKRQAGYKQRIMCYLLSHVNACPIQLAKLAILKSIQSVSGLVKHQVLLPTIQAVFEELSSAGESILLNPFYQDFPPLLVSSFDASSASDLNDSTKPSWPAFERVLRLCFQIDRVGTSRAVLEQNLQRGLFTRLSMERKAHVCRALLDMGQVAHTMSECKQLLTDILTEVPLMLHLLVSLQPTTEDPSQRASKRARLDDAVEKTSSDGVASLSLLMEVLASKSLPGSLELISCLLETLGKVTHGSSAAITDRSYVEQLLMSAVESAVVNVQGVPALLPGSIRLDILVELIRVSENPQTFHQALLVMASLARLAPDAVLHNVMPVFTFMGSNVFHRDDSYSFRVVQKTIDSIVPVMIESLRRSHSERLDLYIASRDFLRIFTDASNHIPRHRRAKFFSHLVDVLGPDEFLPPVCMLLVDKMANRVVRQNAQDAHSSLSLPLTAFQQYSLEQHLSLLVEVLNEVHRLVNQDADMYSHQHTFLDIPQDDEQHDQVSAISKRRAVALLIYCDHALKEMSVITPPKSDKASTTSSTLLTSLLRLATSKDGSEAKGDIAITAQTTIASTLRVMSVVDFVTGALSMIASGDTDVQAKALELLGERLVDVKEDTRHEITTTVVEIVEAIRRVLSSGPATPLIRAAFHALEGITRTSCKGEESRLQVLYPLSCNSKLGPRLIPYLRDIVHECTSVIGEATQLDIGNQTVKEASNVLRTLLSEIPTFWSEHDLTQVIDLHLGLCLPTSTKHESASLATVMKTMAKRVPPHVFIPTLCKAWASSALRQNAEPSRYICYFSLVKRAVRIAPRPVILEHLRTLSAMFQDALGINEVVETKEVEHELLAAFLELVVKLNETAFKPLLRKLCDWAFADESPVRHAITFCHVYVSLLDFFKARKSGLMVPYMSFLWQPLIKQLADASEEPQLWSSVLQTLTLALQYDEGGFWRDDRLQQLLTVLVNQLPVCVQFNIAEGKTALMDVLVAAAEVTNDDALLKTLNFDVLMCTRSEDARLRILALPHGAKMLGFAAETTTFIAECAEDEHDGVVRAAHQLKNAVESIAGSIDVL
ncbi:hypothetical protein B0H21DRAFT_877669 [Amylocystis lapponica]|nr:hypothetical protein B0H21DRAFT_877669 [Amylocystis lapponica]